MVVATQSDDYIHVPLHVAAGIACTLHRSPYLSSRLFSLGNGATALVVFFIQLASFIVLSIILSAPPIRYALPRSG